VEAGRRFSQLLYEREDEKGMLEVRRNNASFYQKVLNKKNTKGMIISK